MKYVAPKIVTPQDDLVVVGASLGTRRKRSAFPDAITDVIGRTARSRRFRTAAWGAAGEPCLQVADSCCWAIQRKWEGGDPRSHVLVEDKIRTEFDAFRSDAKPHDDRLEGGAKPRTRGRSTSQCLAASPASSERRC